MKVKDVPQDNMKIRGRNSRYVTYALDENGNYAQVLHEGWEVQETAILSLEKMFNELAEEARERVRKNETSPIEYFMHHFLLDVPLFAAQMGTSQRKIKKHFKPDIFKKMDDRTLQEYADFFRIDINEIKNFKG